MRLQPVVFLALLSCAVPAAFAQSDDATTTQPARQALDANHDGYITRDEAQARPAIAKHFDQIDTNHDGKIDRQELASFRDKMQSRRAEKQQQQQSSAPAEGSSGG